MKFIMLTNAYTGKQQRFNMERALVYYEGLNTDDTICTMIDFSEELPYCVLETPEEIDKLVRAFDPHTNLL